MLPQLHPNNQVEHANIRTDRRRRWLAELLPVAGLLLAALALFRDGLLFGALFYERDTYVFYYPLEQWVAQQWRELQMPLWLPKIFGGYPIFADGETGMLYPLNWLFLGFLPTAEAFIWRRIAHQLIAGISMYALLRILGCGRAGAFLGAMVFSYGSFFVVQMHHENITRSAVWLPLILVFVELALRRTGWARQRWLLAAGVMMGVAALGLHIQAVAMTAIALGLFTTCRLLLGPVPGRLWERLLLLAWAPGLVVATGLWLAAAQWIPLFELGRLTFRGSGVSYDYASDYAQSFQNLPTLVLPYLFRRPDAARWWTLWDPWETHLYAGLAPLILAGFGVLAARRRPVVFFGLVAILALLISLADESPINLHGLLWQLPGFSSLRAPGRFSFLVLFGMAGLAAFALDDLWRRRPSVWLGLACLVGAALVAGTMLALRERLLADLGRGEEWVLVRYLSVRHSLTDLNYQRVYQDLVMALDPLAPKTAWALALLVLIGLTLLMWRWRVQLGRPCAAVLIALTTLDLLVFAADFHPQGRPETAFGLPPVSEFLAQQAAGQRVSASSTLKAVEPNRLMAAGVVDVAGYSSLPSQRHFDLWTHVSRHDDALADLWGIRFLVVPPVPPDVQIVEGTAFRPYGRLMAGPADNPLGRARFAIEPFRTGELRVLASLGHAVDIEQDEPTTTIRLVGTDGQDARVTLRAGIEVAENAYERPEVVPLVHHARAQVGTRVMELNPYGQPELVNVYLARFPLAAPLDVNAVEVEHVNPYGVSLLLGLGLVDPESGRVRSLFTQDREKLRLVYRDAESVVAQNEEAFPRAFVAPEGVARRSRRERTALLRMTLEPFDPRRTVILEDGPFDDVPLVDAPTVSDEPWTIQAASVKDLDPGRVLVETASASPGYLVLTDTYHRGWRATVDGQPVPVYLADFLFRAVYLPPGTHTVEFTFDPISVRLGAALSLVAIVFVLGAAFALPTIQRRQRTSATPAEP